MQLGILLEGGRFRLTNRQVHVLKVVELCFIRFSNVPANLGWFGFTWHWLDLLQGGVCLHETKSARHKCRGLNARFYFLEYLETGILVAGHSEKHEKQC